MKFFSFYIFLFSFLSLVPMTIPAHAATPEQAQALRDGVIRAKETVDRVISAVRDSGPSMAINENDNLALPIFIEASTSLGQAATFSDEALIALTGIGGVFDPQLGNFKFALSCNRMGISRSQLARANLAAVRPPVGILAPFSVDIQQTIQELLQLKFAVGCP